MVGMKGRGNSYKTVVMETWGKNGCFETPKENMLILKLIVLEVDYLPQVVSITRLYLCSVISW
jgi:hypothetical protein